MPRKAREKSAIGTYQSKDTEPSPVFSGDPTYNGNLACAFPKWHDIINLKNKW